jgi:ankyrin repeat protein
MSMPGMPLHRRDSITFCALHFAAENGTVDGTRVLLEHGADVAAEADEGETAIKGAQNDEVKKLLSEYGAIL